MTSDERETFDDPRMSELLRAWGDEASRGQPLFRPPPELLRRVAEDDGQQVQGARQISRQFIGEVRCFHVT